MREYEQTEYKQIFSANIQCIESMDSNVNSCRQNEQLITHVLTHSPKCAKYVADVTVDLLTSNILKK